MAEGGAAGFPVRPGFAGENAVRTLEIEGFHGRVPGAGRTRPGAPAGLGRRWRLGRGGAGAPAPHQWAAVGRRCGAGSWPRVRPPARLEDLLALAGRRRSAAAGRSEEHTSELQSLMRIPYAVLCLKQKTKTEAHDR